MSSNVLFPGALPLASAGAGGYPEMLIHLGDGVMV